MNARTLGDIALVLWTVPAVAAPIVYSRVPDWRRTPLGRHLMSYMVVIAFVSVLGCYRLAFNSNIVWEVARLIGYAGVVVVLWWRLRVVAQTWFDAVRDASAAERRESDRT